MVNLKGKFELEDLKAAQNLHALPGKRGWITIAVLIGFFFFLFLASIVLAAMGRMSWVLVIYPILILGLIVLYWYVLRPAQIARAYKQHKELSSLFEMDLTDEGYSIKNDYGTGKIPWRDFAKWKADKKIILLYRTDTMFNMVPKRLMQDESQADYVLEQLQKNGVKEASQVKNRTQSLARLVLYGVLVILIIAVIYLNIR